MSQKICACYELIGDNPNCPRHTAACSNCRKRFVIGRNGIETPIGDMCDDCAGVVRNEHGLVIDMHAAMRSEA